MSDKEKFEQTKKDFKEAFLILNNIIEAGSEKIKRFTFTHQEQSVLLFIADLLSSHIQELGN
jgi:hypothetical protein